ncbi:MAG: hypothetical protein Q8O67_26000 [Deltaproteobacteria bacterium]|nr:hypothetical protein [Deltaproteobacteria bacterium]
MRFPVVASLPFLCCLGIALLALSGCGGTPRDSAVQWVARDAWDPTCAEAAIVERFVATNGRWKIEGQVWAVDVDATFKLVNKCSSGLPLIGKEYKQFEAVPFKATVEMSKCKKGDDAGWSLPGKESSRCWTGPTLVAR